MAQLMGQRQNYHAYKKTKTTIATLFILENSLSASVLLGIDNAKGEVISVMDADGQHNPNDLITLYQMVKSSCDICIGSRYIEGATGFSKHQKLRIFASFLTTLCSRTLLNLTVSDPLSGFFACKRSLIQKTRRKMNAVGFKILLELLFYNKNAVIRETPIVFGERMHGNSKANILILYQFVCQVIALVTRIKSPQFISFCLIGVGAYFTHNCAEYYFFTNK